MKKTGPATLIAILLVSVMLISVGCATNNGNAQKAKPGQPAEFTDAEKGIYLRTLPNGLRVVIKVNHTAPVVACYALVHTGSIHEGEYLRCGMSHIFEHVMSGGTTTKRTEDESRKLKEMIGAASNAATSKDYTIYYMTVTSRYFPQAVDLLSDYLVRCTFDKKEIAREFGVIEQEILKGEEEPNRLMYKLFDKTAYDVHPVKYPIIGYVEDFLRVNRQDMTQYYRNRYVPENIVFSIAGDVDPDKAYAVVAEAFKDFEARPLKTPDIPEEPAKHGYRYAEWEANVRTSMVRMGFRTVKMDDPDMYPLDLLAFIAGRGRSSVLNRKIKEDKKLVQDIFAYSGTPDYVHGHFVIGCSLEPGGIKKAESAILKAMQEFSKPLPESALEKAKKQLIAAYIRYRQDVASQASGIGFAVLRTGDPLHSERYVERMKKVRPADITRVAKKYFRMENLTTVALIPRSAKTASELPPIEVAEKKSGFEKFKLKNGLTVLLRRNPALPIVAMQIYSRGGVLYEGDRPGISNLMAQMLMRGTKKRSAIDIFERIDAIGGELTHISGRNTFGLEVEVLKDDAEIGLDLLSDCLINPAFDKEELEKTRAAVLYQIKARHNKWSTEVFDLFRNKYYGTHPYGRSELGGAKGVKALTRGDVVDFHKKFAVGPNTVLAISGDFETAKMKKLVEKYFAPLSSASATPPTIPPAPKLSAGEETKYVKHNRRRQVNVILGSNGAPIGSEDDYAMTVLSTILSRRLHKALRGRNDYVYLVWSGGLPGFGTGAFFILAQTTPQKYDRVMDEIYKELDILFKGGFSDRELDAARRGAISFSEIRAQKNSNAASAAALDELYGYGYDHSRKFPARIAAVTRDDVIRVAKKYFVNWMRVETRSEQEK